MPRHQNNNSPVGRNISASGTEQNTDLKRRDALAKLGQFATAGYMAPALLTLLVSKKATAASGEPPPPPG